MALPYHCGTAGLSAAGECFYTDGMLQVIHTITRHLEHRQADTQTAAIFVCVCGYAGVQVWVSKLESEKQQSIKLKENMQV